MGVVGMNRVIVLIAVLVIAIVAVPVAASQNGTSQAGYGGQQAVEVTLVEGSRVTSSAQSQALPLTGMDAGVLVLGGSILLLVGLGMRRFARQRQ